MNLTELQDEIGRLLNDPNHQRWSTDVLTTRINLAQTVVLSYTNAEKTSESLSPVANTAAVSLQNGVMDILRVTMQDTNGDVYPVDGYPKERLDYQFPNWMNWTAGQPKAYWYDATLNTLYLVPVPSASYAITNGLTVYEVKTAADLVNPSDVPFDSTNTLIPYHLAIVYWVVAECWLDDGTPEALVKAGYHRSGLMERPGEFEKQIKRINQKFDAPEDIPTSVLWRPQGGRVGTWGISKSYPLG